ncbi:MAG: molybdopterin molybdotransferase MoeA [Chitinophagaceae bacterium]|jgi:molybdopterin molybdotransferase|nr:molybdopterin molybdotransferase MoeA [Chitinophagaceae bacterium]OQY95443.1 MAG: hypothetical protein B6D37_05480 [Sphingobacteriales bacterium UTBCD1]
MIGVREAKKIILDNCTTSKTEELPLVRAGGFVLAKPVYSPIDSPPFDQSAMDGYAFSFEHWDKKNELPVNGEVQAGNCLNTILNSNQSVRIFTGAALPAGMDTVVMQEKVSANATSIIIKDEQISKGSNVRPRGSQIRKNEIAAAKNHFLSPASVSFLSGLGIDTVNIYPNPAISIIVTGKELVEPGSKLSDGKIYESNSSGLATALTMLNINPASINIVDDDENKILDAINKQLSSDIILLTGGVSVGDYDFVTTALEKCGATKLFHKVKQKPGKPLYFGKHGHTLIFGLPGNPASALTCFYEYVIDAISSMTKRIYGRKLKLPLAGNYSKKTGLTCFLKGKTSANEVLILHNQESYMMNSFAEADCIIELDEDKEHFVKGDLVPVRLII